MSCPTCDHTMEQLPASSQGDETATYLCPRCGTVKIEEPAEVDPIIYVPKLVERCREFERNNVLNDSDGTGAATGEWESSGITESINTPDNRPKGTS